MPPDLDGRSAPQSRRSCCHGFVNHLFITSTEPRSVPSGTWWSSATVQRAPRLPVTKLIHWRGAFLHESSRYTLEPLVIPSRRPSGYRRSAVTPAS